MAPHTPSPDDHTPTDAGTSGLTDFTLDLTSQEVLRRAHVMEALGPHWNPIEVLHSEETAHNLLYSGLDAQQQRLHDDLTAAGILPTREDGHAAP
ncbi:DUF6400 family protein [Streptomyces erythrochromogenes]|uniref:DUF6400 family protein n=1 Tax=Streptomyces erythrochromogenes TaxID=285574 RepID=A0ABZ1QMV6_9ACTN|nr:DUF6400 family protein [Streptomyces erythrochromogenes]